MSGKRGVQHVAFWQQLFSWGKKETKLETASLLVGWDLGVEQRIKRAGQPWSPTPVKLLLLFGFCFVLKKGLF